MSSGKAALSDIIRKFLLLYFSTESDDVQKAAKNVFKRLLKLFDQSSSSSDDTELVSLCKQWSELCKSQETKDAVSKFGKENLHKMITNLRDELLKTYLFQKVNTNELFENFERELSDPNTILFAQDFDSIYHKEIEKRQKSVGSKRPRDSKDSSSEPPSKKAKLEGQVGDKSLPEKAPVSSEPKIVSTTVTTDSLGPETMYISMSRDAIAKTEEDKGRIGFKVIRNDHTIENLKYLLELRTIFGCQLPKMPKEYITRLVFDTKHRSLLGFKNKMLVGGITFRPFGNVFAEIAFLAITGNEQVKGYGTRLMNHLKQYCQSIGIFRFLTYADNYAIGYFKKQGFTKTITLPEHEYKGYIKDYDGGTLMECVFRPKIDYLNIPGLIKKQRAAIFDKIKEISNSHIVHKGLDNAKRAKLKRIEDIPGIKDTMHKWKPKTISPDVLLPKLRRVYNIMKHHPDSWPFLEPVDGTQVIDYYEVIKEPIDMQVIEQRLKNGFYRTHHIFMADFRRMFDNCRIYNKPDTEYYKCAENMEARFKEEMLKVEQELKDEMKL